MELGVVGGYHHEGNGEVIIRGFQHGILAHEGFSAAVAAPEKFKGPFAGLNQIKLPSDFV